MFTSTVGMTLHRYIQRRRLTEAARLLVGSQKPVIEIALLAGYESQQAFAAMFKSMYKRTPLEYRQHQVFYPLQLEFVPAEHLPPSGAIPEVSYAVPADIPDWMQFTALVIDGFPCLDEAAHRKQIAEYIHRRQARHINFLAVRPQYRRYGAAKALLDFMARSRFEGREISITTFRAGDKADTGQREEAKEAFTLLIITGAAIFCGHLDCWPEGSSSKTFFNIFRGHFIAKRPLFCPFLRGE